MKSAKTRVDPFKGVVKAEKLELALKRMAAGDEAATSYVRGAWKYLRVFPPKNNQVIVPLLFRALRRYV